MAIPTLRSEMSKMVSPNSQGSLFSVMSASEVLVVLISSSAMSKVNLFSDHSVQVFYQSPHHQSQLMLMQMRSFALPCDGGTTVSATFNKI